MLAESDLSSSTPSNAPEVKSSEQPVIDRLASMAVFFCMEVLWEHLYAREGSVFSEPAHGGRGAVLSAANEVSS